MSADYQKIQELLGAEAETLLSHQSKTIPKENLQLPGADFVDRVWLQSDRSPAVLRSMQTLYDTGRLRGTGYLSILPVDQGIEHSAGLASVWLYQIIFITNHRQQKPLANVKEQVDYARWRVPI